VQEYISCDLRKQNQDFRLKYKWKKLKFLHILEIYFGYLGTDNT